LTGQIQYFSSSYFQLVALPLMAVGNALIGKGIEKRALEDHNAIMEELQILKEIHKLLLARQETGDAVNEPA
jgi:hypothetical protein